MNFRNLKLIVILVLATSVLWSSTEGNGNMSKGKILYQVKLVNEPEKSVSVKQSGKQLEFVFEGFESAKNIIVNKGGIEACRTILKHDSNKGQIELSLPIAQPNMPCQMTPGYVSAESESYGLSFSEAEVEKSSGSDSKLRNLVEKYFGTIKGE